MWRGVASEQRWAMEVLGLRVGHGRSSATTSTGASAACCATRIPTRAAWRRRRRRGSPSSPKRARSCSMWLRRTSRPRASFRGPARPAAIQESGMKDPVRVAVTGAAGQIGYSLLFRIASGELLGKDQPVILQLLEITPALAGARRRRRWSSTTARSRCSRASSRPTTPTAAFAGVNYALLVGSRPRTKGMERKELLEVERRDLHRAGQGARRRRGRRRAHPRRRQPGQHELPDRDEQRAVDPARALHRDDAPRPQPRQGAARGEVRGAGRRRSRNMTIWGNHSGDAVPRPRARAGRRQAGDASWSTRPGSRARSSRPCSSAARQIIEARGASSAASAANAAIDHVRDWALGTAAGDWVSMAVCSDGSYGVPEGLISGLPGHDQGRRVVDRPRPRHRRLLACPHRRVGRRAGRGARRGRRARSARVRAQLDGRCGVDPHDVVPARLPRHVHRSR